MTQCKFKRQYTWMLLILFGCSMGIATFYDLAVTELVYDPNNAFGLFLWRYSEMPISLVTLFALALVSVEFKAKDTQIQRLLKRALPLMTLVAGGIMGAQLGSYYESGQNIWILMGILTGHLMLGFTKRLSEEARRKYYSLALRIVIVYVGAVIFPNLIKILWGRPRYHIIVAEGMSFSPWYHPQGLSFINDELKSFPSGHSAIAAVSLLSIYLPRYFESLKGKEAVLLALSVLWTLGVMVSRILIGHHFLSDTIFGAGITIALILIVDKLFINEIKPGDES